MGTNAGWKRRSIDLSVTPPRIGAPQPLFELKFRGWDTRYHYVAGARRAVVHPEQPGRRLASGAGDGGDELAVALSGSLSHAVPMRRNVARSNTASRNSTSSAFNVTPLLYFACRCAPARPLTINRASVSASTSDRNSPRLAPSAITSGDDARGLLEHLVDLRREAIVGVHQHAVQEQAHERVFLEQFLVVIEQLLQLAAGAALDGQRLQHFLVPDLADAREDRGEERVLVLEVPVDRALRDARGASDLVERRADEAALGEHPDADVDDRLARLRGLLRLRRFRFRLR